MKRFIPVLFILFFIFSGCLTSPPVKTVSVTVGSFAYNEDRINVTVEKRSSEIEKAQNDCNIIINSIKKLLIEQGLKDSEYNLSENSTYKNQDSKSDSDKYIVRKGFDIRLSDDINADNLMTKLQESGATGVHRNVFDRTAKDKAPTGLKSILKTAEKKASVIADEAGLSLGNIISIDEMDYGMDDTKIYNIKFQMK